MFSFRAKGNWENSKRIEVTDIRKLLLEDVSYLPSEFLGIYGLIKIYYLINAALSMAHTF